MWKHSETQAQLIGIWHFCSSSTAKASEDSRPMTQQVEFNQRSSGAPSTGIHEVHQVVNHGGGQHDQTQRINET
jgi:hypothetical protein